ncbi:peptide/nickel transport system permease protein [Albimonas donghaensis]|uniref:Peptide/nickel transport system permease protein n=1 Tax=Albimonas donghaensis TaxID=356660 RepID=A0A1H2TQ55_9RHOB|nr:ABC transporter permease [Albimonas donghaensis]SDW45399.1 peptide/nickel transport system permease protein [Albimonas donghaensis]
MLRYLLSRLGRALVTLVLIVSAAFIVLRLSGDPAITILGPEAPPEAYAAFRAAWGLDQPIWMQYLKYFGAIAQGDLGNSMRDGRTALEVVGERVPMTLAITLPAFALNLLIGLPAGIFAALNRNTWADRAIMAGSVMGFTVPSFVMGLVLALIFAVKLRWLPSGGSDTISHAILPVVTMGVIGAAVIARFTRSAMLEVLGQPYVRTASAKGLVWREVIVGHVLPNAAIPTLTIIGFMVGSLVAGAVVVESIFSWPGVGRLLVTAVANRDLAVVQVIILMIGTTMVGANLAVDLAYGWVDPRLRTARLKTA